MILILIEQNIRSHASFLSGNQDPFFNRIKIRGKLL